VPLKKCGHCGTISLDEDIMCGVCGSSIANTPMIDGRSDDVVLRDRGDLERASAGLRQRFTGVFKRRTLRNLLMSISAIAVGSATLIYGITLGLSFNPTFPPAAYPQDFFGLLFLVDILALAGAFALIILGLNLGIRGGTSGNLSIIPGGRPLTPLPSSSIERKPIDQGPSA
jgi:hypothetical protein